MTLAEKIVSLRKAHGWSQEDFAEKLNVSRQAISRWENGTALPDAQNVLQISKLFGVTTDYLLNDDYESDKDIPVGNLEKAIVSGAGRLLEKVKLFDVYEGSQIPEGKKSVAYSVWLRSPDATLTLGISLIFSSIISFLSIGENIGLLLELSSTPIITLS